MGGRGLLRCNAPLIVPITSGRTRVSDGGEVTAGVACAEVGTLSLAGATLVRIYHGPFGRARDT